MGKLHVLVYFSIIMPGFTSNLGAVHNYQHFQKGTLFLTPFPSSPKCTTIKVPSGTVVVTHLFVKKKLKKLN